MKRYIHTILCITISMMLPFASFAITPVANFSANTTSGCSPIVTTFTDISTNTPTSWYWDLGNGSTSTIQNPSTTYITPGTYTVMLVATNASGSDTIKRINYITVAPSPIVTFTADSTPSCTLPRTVTFTNSSIAGSSGTTTYFWDFGDGTTSTAQSPTKTYTAAGNYTIVLLVTNGLGCSKSTTKVNYIKVSQKPTAGFTGNVLNSCNAPLTVAFTNNSVAGATYDWDFGDGSTSTSVTPSHTYTTNGTYNVRLITTNAAGCKDTMTRPAYISIDHPTAGFNLFPTTVCRGKNVFFTNTSTPAGYGSSWDFADGSSSTGTSPTKSFSTAGSYNVRLVVQKNGCYDTVFHMVTVLPSPIAAFTGTPLISCTAPLTTNFTNSSTGAASYAWVFGNGNTSTSTSPSNTYSALGSYNVTLVATGSNGCADTLIRPAYVRLQAPTATITKASYSGCAPVTVAFTANISTLIPVTNYSWNWGDASTPTSCASCSTQSHTYTASGTYTVTLTYTTGTGCSFNATTTVVVSSKPTAAFTATPTTICPYDTVKFSNTSTGALAYEWFFGDGGTSTLTNPGYTGYEYPAGGIYTVTLVANNAGCKDTFTRSNYITVHPPLAKFSAAASCSNRFLVTVKDSSLGATSYSWNWGDGNTSTQAGGTLSHTYASAGTYTITLTVYNATYGCSHTLKKTLRIHPLVASFSISDTTLCRTNGATVTAGTSPAIANYYWDFGDISGNTTQTTFGHAWNTAGIYTVKLVVSDSFGCKDSLIKPNYVRVGGPTVAFSGTPRVGCLPLTVNFVDSSTPNGGFGIARRTWGFGYGPAVQTTNTTISNTYVHSGVWSVELYVLDSNGCQEALYKGGYIKVSHPVAQFYTNDTVVCVGKPVVIYNNSGGEDFTCMWYWGDGTTSTLLTPTHTYTTPGVYTIKLVITDATGCVDSAIHVNYVKVMTPNVGFTMSDTAANCPPLAVNFTDTSSSVVSYTWVFDNGSQSSLPNPSTIYTYPGTYHVKLIGTSNGGCKDSVTKNIVVRGPTGTFSYSPLTGCNPVTVSFTSSTTGASQLIWDMSNGFTDQTTTSTYSYTYTSTGRYVPKLILSDGASCLVPIQGLDTIKVDQTVADFTFTPTVSCGPTTVQFKDTVLSTISAVASYSWNFGDGGTGTTRNPSHAYAAAGSYNARLIVTNLQGCSDTIIKTVVIHAIPTVTGVGTRSICQGDTTHITISATGAATYTWSPGTGLSCTSCQSPLALPAATTTYIVTGTDTNGCTDTGKVVITVAPTPAVTASGNATICEGRSTILTGNGATSYTWSPATALSCTSCTSATATPTATTAYVVTGTDGNGCSDTGMVTVTVNAKPVLIASGNKTICDGTSVKIGASGAASYVWMPSTGLSCTSCDSTVASPTVTTTYKVAGIGSNGCTDTATITVNVSAKPTVGAGSNVAVCAGNPTTLNATGAVSYVWTPTASLSCSTCVNPVATPTTTTTYTVTGTNAGGCSNTATVTVTVNAIPTVSAGPDVTICEGNSTTLTGSGAVSYVWSPATALSCPSCTAPIANPTTTLAYIVTGTDANGCTDTGKVTVTVNPKPTVSAGSNQTICTGSSVSLTASGTVSYVWSPSTGLSCTACATTTASPTTTTAYTVTGTNANGCTNTASVTVNVNPKPTIVVNGTTTICAGTPTTLTASGAVSYVWSPATGLSCTACTSPTASPAITTTYTVTGTNANGCVNTNTVTVNVTPLPVITASGSKTICVGESAALTVTGATTYSWSPAGTLSCATCPNPIATPTTTTTYIVIGTTNGCSIASGVVVTVRPQPAIKAGQDKQICVGEVAALQASGGASYEWTPSAGLSCSNCPNPNANPTTTTTYIVKGTDGDGCINTDTMTLTVNPLPIIDAGPDQTICIGATVQLHVTGGVTYTWSGGSKLSCVGCADPTATPTVKTSYSVKGVDANGCSNSDSVTVSVIEKGPVSVGPGDTLCKGESAILHAKGGTSYLWTPSAGLSDPTSSDPTATPDVTTNYTLLLKQGDCFVDTSHVLVIVHDQPEVSLGEDLYISGGSPTKLFAKTNMDVKYVWTPVDYLSCGDCQSPEASPFKTITYIVTATNEWGCSAKDDITIHVTCDGSQIFLANTFTPNNDGVNDMFYPQGKGIYAVKSLRVFNRWGELMFSRQDMPLNDPNAGWDGTLKGAPLKPDVFVYIINAFCESGAPIELKGDISLIR